MNFLLKEIHAMGGIRTCNPLIERRESEPLYTTEMEGQERCGIYKVGERER